MTSHPQVAVVLIRLAGLVLMVRQQAPQDPCAYWALPGGVCEPAAACLKGMAARGSAWLYRSLDDAGVELVWRGA